MSSAVASMRSALPAAYYECLQRVSRVHDERIAELQARVTALERQV